MKYPRRASRAISRSMLSCIPYSCIVVHCVPLPMFVGSWLLRVSNTVFARFSLGSLMPINCWVFVRFTSSLLSFWRPVDNSFDFTRAFIGTTHARTRRSIECCVSRRCKAQRKSFSSVALSLAYTRRYCTLREWHGTCSIGANVSFYNCHNYWLWSYFKDLAGFVMIAWKVDICYQNMRYHDATI